MTSVPEECNTKVAPGLGDRGARENDMIFCDDGCAQRTENLSGIEETSPTRISVSQASIGKTELCMVK